MVKPPVILTVTKLAKIKGVTVSYIRRLCRLPKGHKLHIESYKPHPRLHVITDKKILKEILKEISE